MKSFLKGRFYWAIAVVLMGLGALIARATYVQVVNSEPLMNEADKRSLRTQTILSVRGSISRSMGQLLSVSVPMYAVVADPEGDFDRTR